MFVKTSTPPEVMDEDCLRILYYHYENFTICQRVVEIRLNEGNEDSSKKLESDFSQVHTQNIGSELSRDSSTTFTPFFLLFVKALLRHLGRKFPIDAEYNPDIIQTWLSNNEPRRDLIVHSSIHNNLKSEFITNLSSYLSSKKQTSGPKNATSQYTKIYLPLPSTNELEAMTFLSFQKNKQSDEAYPMHRDNMEKYLRRTDF